MMGRPARPEDTSAELTVPFPQGVPIYVTYLTALPDTGKIAYSKDVYGWDARSTITAQTAMQAAGRGILKSGHHRFREPEKRPVPRTAPFSWLVSPAGFEPATY